MLFGIGLRSAAIALALAAAASGGSSAAAAKAQRPWLNASLNPDRRAELALRAMTREEKLTLVFGYFATDADWKKYKAPKAARYGSAGYIPGIARLGIPPQWQTDAGVGVATQGAAPSKRERTSLPSGLATAATWNPQLAFQGGAMIGDEARRSGFNVMLAGGVNLLRDPRNGRNFEYGGEDPLLAGVMVGSQIAGIQSNKIISTVKHYAMNDLEAGRNYHDARIGDSAARMSDLLAFQFAIERGNPGSVMCAYNRVNGDYACENAWLLRNVLKADWRYPGYVMSDWGATHSTEKAVESGLDQQSGWPFDDAPFYGAPLREALARGNVPQGRLDDMARRILRSMFAHGLVDRPVRIAPIDFASHARISRADAEEAAVLLKNDSRLLPLRADTRRIAVIGGHADKGVLAGSGSSLVYPRGGNAVPDLEPKSWPGPVMYDPSPPLAAIRRLAPAAVVSFDPGTNPVAAAAAARAAEVAIVFVTQWAGESFDPPLSLGAQDALVEAVAAANPNTVVVVESGGPVLMPWAGRVKSILEAWYPGTSGGEAIANLLLGAVNPSGRLPATFPKDESQLPRPVRPGTGLKDKEMFTIDYSEGAAVGYKWFDRNNLEPQFPFGHGLGYSEFAYSGLKAQVTAADLFVTFTVKNVGKVAGKDVPQVYVAGDGWEAPKRLGAFRKVALAPGQETRVTVRVDPRLLATFDSATRTWRIAPGTYEVLLGRSSRDIAARASVRLPARVLPVGYRP